MSKIVFTKYTASISDLKKNPMEIAFSGNGEPVVILNRNNPEFYCVPAELYQKMFEIVEDYQLIMLAEESNDNETIEVSSDELQAFLHKKMRKTSKQD